MRVDSLWLKPRHNADIHTAVSGLLGVHLLKQYFNMWETATGSSLLLSFFHEAFYSQGLRTNGNRRQGFGNSNTIPKMPDTPKQKFSSELDPEEQRLKLAYQSTKFQSQ